MEGYKALMQVAKGETGLDAFGMDSFVEGLEILVTALNREAKLNAMGEAYLRGRIVGHLKQRLQIEYWYRKHPEIDELAITAPLIGISLPRTGSTTLSFLLAEDSNARSLRSSEAAEPCPPPAARSGNNTVDAAFQRAPGMKAHVPMGEDGPAECQDLMALDFKSQIFLAFAQVPTYADWLLEADLTSTYLYERRALKILQWQFPPRPWRLKCPTHLLYLKHLDMAFPDARFVMTHRDPAEVMRSVIGVYADIAGKFTDYLDLGYLTELNLEQWSEGMKRALAFREAGNESRFYDIHFQAMQRDPIGQIKGLYTWLDEPVSEEFEAGMERWWRTNAETREPSSNKDAAADGLDIAKVRPLFKDYVARMDNWVGKI